MFSQLVPLGILLDLLEKCCERDNDGNFIVDEVAYKRMIFHGYHHSFLATCMECYQRCHRHFVTRPLTYKSWSTIIRHISKSHSINGLVI